MTCYVYTYVSQIRSSITKTLHSQGLNYPPTEEQKKYIVEHRAYQNIISRNEHYQPAVDRLQPPPAQNQNYYQPPDVPQSNISKPLPDSFKNPDVSDWKSSKFDDGGRSQNYGGEDLNKVD